MPFILFKPEIGPLLGAATPGLSGPGSDGNKGVLYIYQSSSITGTSPSDCLVSYQDTRGWGSYPSAEVQPVDSTAATAKWTKKMLLYDGKLLLVSS